MSGGVINKRYLPFTEDELAEHFADVGHGHDVERNVAYYRDSAANYRAFAADGQDRFGLPLSRLKRPLQIEKDERFWVAACLMQVHRHEAVRERWAAVLSRCFADGPPLAGIRTWEECLTGDLRLYFEANLPSPPGYGAWLQKQLASAATGRHVVPYIRDAAGRLGDQLEGPTHVDALLLNRINGFHVLFEAKVLSDTSYLVSFDPLRNQIVRNVDVMLERERKTAAFPERDPDRGLFVLLTPKIFRDESHARLYGWLMDAYRADPELLAHDLCHRRDENVDWFDVSHRLGWLTWEACEEAVPGVCPWLAE